MTQLTPLEQSFLIRINSLAAEADALEQDMRAAAKAQTACDPRWVAIGRTHLQEGLMALKRSVENPQSFI